MVVLPSVVGLPEDWYEGRDKAGWTVVLLTLSRLDLVRLRNHRPSGLWESTTPVESFFPRRPLLTLRTTQQPPWPPEVPVTVVSGGTDGVEGDGSCDGNVKVLFRQTFPEERRTTRSPNFFLFFFGLPRKCTGRVGCSIPFGDKYLLRSQGRFRIVPCPTLDPTPVRLGPGQRAT